MMVSLCFLLAGVTAPYRVSPVLCGPRLTCLTCLTCGCGVSGVFVWFCVGFVCSLVVLSLLFDSFLVSFGFVFFPFAPLHALALLLTGAQRTDSSFASKKSRIESARGAGTARKASVKESIHDLKVTRHRQRP